MLRVCETLEEVRREIDRIDQAMVALLVERGNYVAQAARLKTSLAEVPAPARVAQVLHKMREASLRLGGDPEIAEKVWAAMIGAFIAAEARQHQALHADGVTGQG